MAFGTRLEGVHPLVGGLVDGAGNQWERVEDCWHTSRK